MSPRDGSPVQSYVDESALQDRVEHVRVAGTPGGGCHTTPPVDDE